ncbi:sensor histidine kinase [Cohnella silvisoli]|uniref:histidine kinase n=1 Tax=Cohnella silvisoli TaxID=2873699 RepID=A0ABV1KTU7_9BACL|nr:HAMP domain-containing sensor histidine kinase [Cohnella silvisoli]MCD9021479.1 HAMP domain-containing histidine kinase [Cohnella silvisoli]
MSIRMKLLLSYAAMLVVPLLLLVLMALSLVFFFRGDLQNLQHFYESKAEGFEEDEFYHLIKRTIVQNPSLLADRHYLDEISKEISSKETYLVIRINGETGYASEGIRERKDFIASLPGFRKTNYREKTPAHFFENEYYSYIQNDILSAARQPVSLFLVTRVDPLVHLARQYFPLVLGLLLVVLIATHVLLTYLMSKNIIRPLRDLRNAAKLIKEGDLDFHVKVRGKDEIGQLGLAFEEMRDRLQQSIRIQMQYEENRKELVSNISHDLKTPITAIQGYVDGILEGIADSPEKTEKYIRTISAKAEEMDHLINELFLYSKLDLKRLPFHFEQVPIYAFLSDWAEELKFELDKIDVRFETDMDLDQGTYVLMDRDNFRRVLTNIIQNSLRYMDKKSKTIRILVSDEENIVTIVIEDNGPGISEAALPYIFDRFYRAEQSRNAYTGGTGLGLAIAKQIMEGHGGDIRASSTLGEGLRIIITMPIHIERGGKDE